MPTTPPTGVLGVNPRRRSRQTEPMEAAAADRLEGLSASFARAGDVVAEDYIVGGSRVSLRFASDALRVLDSEAGLAWYWIADAGSLPSWERACPIRQILFWFLAPRGYLQVHGAAVGTPEGGALIVGPAGSGKSTTALACLGSDLLYAGDDYVAVALEPSPRVASPYNSGKIEKAHLRDRLPRLLPHADRLDDEKAVVYAERHFPQQTTAGFPLPALP